MKSNRGQKKLTIRGLWWWCKKLLKPFIHVTSDDNFLYCTEKLEVIVSKILAIAMIFVILVAILNLGVFILSTLFLESSDDAFSKTLFKIFGMFLNILIALEILQNLTAYLKKPMIQGELIIIISLIAVARKIIILDLEKTKQFDLIGLALAILTLSISYWILRHMNGKYKDE